MTGERFILHSASTHQTALIVVLDRQYCIIQDLFFFWLEHLMDGIINCMPDFAYSTVAGAMCPAMCPAMCVDMQRSGPLGGAKKKMHGVIVGVIPV